MLYKILIVDPDGLQRITEVEETGKTDATVLFDERVDGKMDQLMLDRAGGFRKLNGVLVFDQTVKDANEVKKSDVVQKKDEDKQRSERLKGLDKVSTLDELKPLLKDLVEHLGL